MAKATVTTKTEEVMIKKEVKSGVTLELSFEEVLTLKVLLGKVGGSPVHSVRKYTQDVYNVLCDETGYVPSSVTNSQLFTPDNYGVNQSMYDPAFIAEVMRMRQ